MPNPWTALAALVVGIALLAGGYGWGARAAGNAWQAKAAKAERAAAQKLAGEHQRAETAAGNFLRNQLDEEQRYADLQGRFDDLRRRAPLVVARPVVAASCAAPPSTGVDALASAPPPAVAQPPAAPDGPELSLAAVRLWNAALTGADAPAGACGAAGAPGSADAACAQGSGLDVGDAWANHERNARSCAADRARYRALIEFLSEGK
ncbi:MAG: hypothetical protein JSR68_08345 [Proteobacteria bacterium]|nr:hypothetical protein [Pseudomonadota bacterium]